jgi:hypothetical protein
VSADPHWARRDLARLEAHRAAPGQPVVTYAPHPDGGVALLALLPPGAIGGLAGAAGRIVLAADRGDAPAVVLTPPAGGAVVALPLPVDDPELRLLTRRLAGQERLVVVAAAGADGPIAEVAAPMDEQGRAALAAGLAGAPGSAAPGAALAAERARTGRPAVLAETPDGRVAVLAALPRSTLEGLRGGVALRVAREGGRPSVRVLLEPHADELLALPLDLADPALGMAARALATQSSFTLILADPEDPEAVLEQQVALPRPAAEAILRAHGA